MRPSLQQVVRLVGWCSEGRIVENQESREERRLVAVSFVDDPK